MYEAKLLDLHRPSAGEFTGVDAGFAGATFAAHE